MKIDVTQIEGYENMSPEEKLKALEGFDIPSPDYSGYVKKDLYDKTASELAAKKKELKERLSDDERENLERAQREQECGKITKIYCVNRISQKLPQSFWHLVMMIS